jgi:hypothetical protein
VSARLAALCARLGCEWTESHAPGRVTLTLHRAGVVIGTASGSTLDAAVAVHEEIPHAVLPPVRRRPIEDVLAHPALGPVVHSTKRVDVRAVGAMRDWIEAAAQDPQGRAVRLWVETEEMSNEQ